MVVVVVFVVVVVVICFFGGFLFIKVSPFFFLTPLVLTVSFLELSFLLRISNHIFLL